MSEKIWLQDIIFDIILKRIIDDLFIISSKIKRQKLHRRIGESIFFYQFLFLENIKRIFFFFK